ncbi:unnamed protein product, partial [Laminaria digitata]
PAHGRRTAWGLTSPEPLLGTYEAPSNRFPFPRSATRGGDVGRRGDGEVADRDPLVRPAPREVRGGGSSQGDVTRWAGEPGAARTPSHVIGRGGVVGGTGG